MWCALFGQESNLNGTSADGKTIGCETEDESVKLLSAELMKCHVQFGHVSFQQLQLMAKAGIVPKQLANCPTPVCSASCYAKAIHQQWQSKTAENKG